ncbi:MAG TPA: hypothetical protein VH415_14100 [Nitrososphaeraceae archaeon]|jgi:hypothetical protein
MKEKPHSLVFKTVMATSVLLLAIIIVPVSASIAPQQLSPSLVQSLGVKWWQWAFSFPSDKSPLTDLTGARCDKGDQGNVFFLAGIAGPTASSGKPVERTCNVPISHKQPILIPILNAACLLNTPCLNADKPVTNIKQLQNELKLTVDAIGRTEAKVDGVKLDTSKNRVQSALFKVNVAKNNPFDLPEFGFPTPPGEFVATADGYWLYLKPLSPGPHTIQVKGFVPVEGLPDFVIDVTYHITVK